MLSLDKPNARTRRIVKSARVILFAGENVFSLVPFIIPASASALIASRAHAWFPRSIKRSAGSAGGRTEASSPTFLINLFS